jgi:hypothetical protein
MKSVVFFISTGRCGTQWLTNVLDKAYPELAVVTHEPLGSRYCPKHFLRAYDRMAELQEIEVVKKHLEWIEGLSDDLIYVELGWPCFAAIPLLCEYFQGKIKLVHLVRHPVNTSLSLVTHNFYQPEIRNNEYIKLAQLDPFDAGVIQKSYAEKWNAMTPYEKCLFQWTEINLYALELRNRFKEVPFLQLKMEELITPSSGAMELLADFLALPFQKTLIESIETRFDNHYNLKTHLNFDWHQIFNHPDTVTLAQELGYNFEGINQENLAKRYQAPIWLKIRRAIGIIKHFIHQKTLSPSNTK